MEMSIHTKFDSPAIVMMMKFSININKSANFYFFIQNLSEWHFSNRKDYNDLWRKELGKFSEEEATALKKFKEIRLQHKSAKTIFEQAFFVSQNPWEKLKIDLPPEDYAITQKVFNNLEEKFNLLWEHDLPLLVKWQKELDDKINEESLLKSILDALIALFNSPSSEQEVKTYLLFSSPIHTGGGANIDKQSISLEISRYPTQDVNHAIGIIWHETIHLCFQNQYFFPLLLKQFPNDPQKVNFINEIIIGSLFPKGILGIRLLKNKPANKLMANISPEQTVEIINLTKKYVNDKKPLDDKYINTIAEILKKQMRFLQS